MTLASEWSLGAAAATPTVLDLPDAPGPARDNLVLQHVLSGDAETHWSPLVVSPRLQLLVMSDALKLGGVRIGAGAKLAQQCADALGAMLVTPRVLDLMYAARAVTLPPELQYDATQMATTHWMVKYSARVDAALAAAGGAPEGGIVQTVGKPFVLSNLLLAHPGKSVNYSWYCPPGSVSGGKWQAQNVPAYPSVSLPDVYVLQQPSWGHNAYQSDYASVMVFMHQKCVLDGKQVPTSQVLQDPALASLVSQEGVLRVLRQPGVGVVAPSAASGGGGLAALILLAAAGVVLLL